MNKNIISDVPPAYMSAATAHWYRTNVWNQDSPVSFGSGRNSSLAFSIGNVKRAETLNADKCLSGMAPVQAASKGVASAKAVFENAGERVEVKFSQPAITWLFSPAPLQLNMCKLIAVLKVFWRELSRAAGAGATTQFCGKLESEREEVLSHFRDNFRLRQTKLTGAKRDPAFEEGFHDFFALSTRAFLQWKPNGDARGPGAATKLFMETTEVKHGWQIVLAGQLHAVAN